MNSQVCLTMLPIPNSGDLPLRDRSFVVALVVLAHALLLLSYTSSSSQSTSVPREMSVSMALPSPPQTAPVKPKPPERQTEKPIEKPIPIEPQPVQQAAEPEMPVETMDPSPQMENSPAQPENVASALPDREPDYQAAYLNNPLPAYPMVARRMGWQGRVVLNVEVLESGSPGQIKLHQSSGRDVLDNAAMQAVRGWRFVPARQNGQAVAKSFLVPIPFILKED